MAQSLADLGERKLIAMVRRQYGYAWSDDDAAAIDSGKNYTLITTDAISKGSHIPDGAGLANVGYFFAALNLSDIAAMGGKPKYFMAAMTLPKRMPARDLAIIESGIRRCLEKYAVRLIGGDLKQGMELNLAGIAIGTVPKERILRRSGAKQGDLVCITGKLGKNGAAYYMWKSNKQKKWANLLINIEPRIKEGLLISEFKASCAIDLSDGLFSAVSQLNHISRQGFEIEYDKVPVHSIAKTASRKLGIGIEEIAFNFGGEYELLFTISKANFLRLERAAKRKGMKISVIGRVYGRSLVLIKNGKRIEIKKMGYEHFSR